MSTEAKSEAVAKGITPKSLTLSAIIIILTYAIFFYSFHPRVAGAPYWFTHYLVYLGWRWYFGWETILFPLMIIVSLLALVSKKFSLTKQEWTIVYAVASIVVPSTFWWGIWAWCMNTMLGTEKFKHLLEYIPSNWVPKDYNILAAYWESRNPFEWTIPYADAWTGPIVTWVLYYIFFNIMLYGLVLVFQKRMIEVEKLPYPVTMTTLAMINYISTPVTEGSKRNLLWSKKALVFWIGFFFGVFYEIFYLFPGDIFKHPPFVIPGDIDWQGKFPPFQRSVLSYFVTPSQVGLYFLFSLDILFTATLFHIILLIILPAVFVSTGIYPSQPTSEWGAWHSTLTKVSYGFAGTYNFIFLTMTFGIALYLLWYTRDDWIASFKRFLKGEPAEKGEPVSPRVAWLMLLGGALLLFVWMCASEIHPVASFLGILYILLIWFAVLRFSGEAWSCHQLPWGFRMQNPDRHFAYYVSEAVAGHASTTGYGLAYIVSNATCYQPHSSLVPAIFSYKIAYETKTDPKEVFKIQVPVVILASILSVVIGWYTIGLQGMSNWSHGWTTSWDGALNNGLGAANYVTTTKNPPDPIFGTCTAIGIVLGAILMFLRTRFPWFIINPIAVPLLTLYNFYTSFSVIIALIAKFLVVKVAGVKIYSEYAVPFAVGMFFGSVLLWNLGYPIVLYLRYGIEALPI
ncbi:MAG: hypothetical protein DRN04_12990 [Thermoprotei archaeon]|nr:MAG: hypothetical protein DRN04_12990 [Thermoprotei archaeon]